MLLLILEALRSERAIAVASPRILIEIIHEYTSVPNTRAPALVGGAERHDDELEAKRGT